MTITLDVTTIDGVMNDGSVDVGSLISAKVVNDMTLYFPEGTYLFTKSLYIEKKSNIIIKGTLETFFKKDGDNTYPVVHMNGCVNCSIYYIIFYTYKDKSATNETPILLINSIAADSSYISVNNSCFVDCSLNFNKGAMILIDGNGSYGSSYNTIRYCTINGNSRCGVGISQSKSKHNSIYNNIITNTGYESVTIDNASNFCSVTKNAFSYSYNATGLVGIDNSHDVLIDSNSFISMYNRNGIGVYNNFTEEYMIAENEDPDTYNIVITNNNFQKCSNGIYAIKNNTTAYDFTITGNQFNYNTCGIYLNGIDLDTFEIGGNVFAGNTTNLTYI